MATIPLDRRFLEWSDNETSDPEARSYFNFDDDRADDWDDLLRRRRVVVLAEAGSGKTEEMKEQARRQIAADKFAFYATVQDVGRKGLVAALAVADQARLTAWRSSGEPAWFFIDSVDEAKLDGIRLEQALREISIGVHGAEGRAHVVLSGRHTDWEFRRDLNRFNEILPIPQDHVPQTPYTPDELLIKTIRRELRDADRFTSLVAGRALVATSDEVSKKRYVAHVKANLGTLRLGVVWHAIESLFPNYLSVDDLLSILGSIDITDPDSGRGFEWGSPDLIGRIRARSDLERLLTGLLAQLGGEPGNIDVQPDAREKAYFPAIGAAADRLLELCGEQEAPLVAVDAVLRLGEDRHERRARKALGAAATELTRSTARRRIAFWRASERLAGHRILQGSSPLELVWQIETLGFSPGLQLEDIEWLLADGPKKAEERERRLAVNAAMQIWRDNNSQESLRDQIKAVVAGDPVMQAAFDTWLKPRIQSAQEKEFEAKHKLIMQEHDLQRAKEDKGWQDFAADIRADPQQLRKLIPVSEKGVDQRLFVLWELLNTTAERNSRYAIESVAPLEPMIGVDAAAATRDGLMAHWKAWKPRLHSERAPDKRNNISSIDCMGIVGVTLEAATIPTWAMHLSSDLAKRAAAYATLEINGFPKWITDLARDKPDEMREVLVAEIVAELDHDDEAQPFEVLRDAARADQPVTMLLARPILDELERRPNVNERALVPMLDVITAGLAEQDRNRFTSLILDRFNSVTDYSKGTLYISSLFGVDPQSALDALEERLESLSPADQTRLVQGVLPELFGDGRSRRPEIPPSFPFKSLERLVEIAYRTIRISEDKRRPSGVVYSPDARDDAESARGAAFTMFAQTPGRQTYDALLRLAKKRGFPIEPSRLRALAYTRAAQDAESPEWSETQVIDFEQTSLTVPSTTRELQRVAQSRIFDMQHDLLNSDFAQGQNLHGLPNEQAVQNWVADRFRVSQGRSYSVEREPHVVEEKEPDVRLRAKSTDASLPIEIKVAESWSLPELEDALKKQLCGRYLRARDGRHGILLLVHKKPRPRGWKRSGKGRSLNFKEVVDHLRAMATSIAAISSDSPQPEIAILDVSSVGLKKKAKTAKRGRRRVSRASVEARNLEIPRKKKATRKRRGR